MVELERATKIILFAPFLIQIAHFSSNFGTFKFTFTVIMGSAVAMQKIHVAPMILRFEREKQLYISQLLNYLLAPHLGYNAENKMLFSFRFRKLVSKLIN